MSLLISYCWSGLVLDLVKNPKTCLALLCEKIFVIFRISIFASMCGKLAWSAGIVRFLQSGRCSARAALGILSGEYFRTQLKCLSISSVKPNLLSFVLQLNTPPHPPKNPNNKIKQRKRQQKPHHTKAWL